MPSLPMGGAGPTGPGYASIILGTSGLLSYWRLGEASGTSATDSKGSNTGTYVGSPTLGTTGAVVGNTAVTLNGSSQDITVPDVAALRFTTSFSLEAWVNLVDYAAFYMIITKNLIAQNEYEWRINSVTGKQNLMVDTGPTVDNLSNSAVPTGQWCHIVATYDGANVRFYLNGATDGAPAQTTVPTTNTATVHIGSRNSTNWFKGGLDEVAVYNTVLSATDVAAHYNARNAP